MGVSMYLEGDCWGACLFSIVQFLVLGPPQAGVACGQQGLQVLLGGDAVFPHLGEFVGEVYVALPPFEGCEHDVARYAVIWASEGAIALTVMASPCNSIAFTILQVAHCNSSTEQNKTTNSMAE